MADNLVTLRTGTGHALVFVHPASGLGTAFRRLVPHLPGSAAVFAFENLEPPSAPCSPREIASGYWAQLAGPAARPMILAGWSFGGMVALELARAGEAAGHEVAAVVLIDAGAPQLLRPVSSIPLHELAGLFEIATADLPADAAPSSGEEALEIIVEVLRRTRGMPQIDIADLRPFVDTYRWHLRAARCPWEFAGCRAPVFLVRARDEEGWRDAPADLGWSAVLGMAPPTLWTPGTHYDLLSPEHAPHLARVLSSVLARLGQPSTPRCGAARD